MLTTLDKNTALIVIDLQEGIATGQFASPVNNVIDNAARLVAAFRRAGALVVIVHVNPIGAPWTLVRSQEPSFPKDAEGQKLLEEKWQAEGYYNILPQVTPQPGDLLVTKKTWSAFYETGLHEALQERGVTGIVLAGVSTSIGVEGTARAASERGYNICFASDAMTDRAGAAHLHSLNVIFPRIGEIDTTDAIIEKLNAQTSFTNNAL